MLRQRASHSTLARVTVRIPRMVPRLRGFPSQFSKCTAEQLLALADRSVIGARYAASRAVASFRGCGTAGLSPSSPRGWQCHSGFLTAQIYRGLRVSESCLCINRTCVDLQPSSCRNFHLRSALMFYRDLNFFSRCITLA